jgi:hypothetical protein
MRRLLIIGAVVIVLAGIGVGVYFVFFANKVNIVVAPQDTTGTLPQAGTTTTPIQTETPQTVDTTQLTKVTQRLVEISKGPVASGEVVFAASTTDPAGDTAVHYIERQSGNVFQYLVHAGSLTRTSNKTIPGIQEALWLPNGSLAYVRYLSGDSQSTINTYALPANGTGGYFLAQNIVSLGVSATNILTLASGGNGSVGTLSKPDGSNAKQVFTSPLSSLRVSFLGTGQYLAFTKPSGTLAGFAYLVNSTGNFERVAGPLNGLVALASPSGKWVLFSYASNGILKLALYDMTKRVLLPLPIATIVDKCVWMKDDSAVYCGVPKDPPTAFAYPDDWYQGAISFSDRIWKVDVAGRFAELTLDFEKEAKAGLDTTAPAIDATGTVLVFRNKNDASLWSYEL